MEFRKIIVDGFETEYSATAEGLVYSHKRSKFLTPVVFRNGYHIVSLCLPNRKIKQFLIHRLVALCFLENPNNYPQINHIDSDKSNNKLINLEWCTPLQNTRHKINTGRGLMGEEIHNSVLTEAKVLEIRRIYGEGGISQRKLAKQFNVSQYCVACVVQRKYWKHV